MKEYFYEKSKTSLIGRDAELTLIACGKKVTLIMQKHQVVFLVQRQRRKVNREGIVQVSFDELSVTSIDVQVASPNKESLFVTDDYYKST